MEEREIRNSRRPTLAAVWLEGCSGCTTPFEDTGARFPELAAKFDLIYSQFQDTKTFPDLVDITLVEGAVASEDDLQKIKKIRPHTNLLIALSDCAASSSTPTFRNPHSVCTAISRIFAGGTDLPAPIPKSGLSRPLARVRAVHEVVPVDILIPGCPPQAEAIYRVFAGLVKGGKK